CIFAKAPAPTVIVPEFTFVSPDEVAWITPVPATLPVKTALLLSPAATRSLSTTPPVFVANNHALAATFDTKLLNGSREMEKTVIEVPDTNIWAGTTVPDPVAEVSTRTMLGAAGFTVIAGLV